MRGIVIVSCLVGCAASTPASADDTTSTGSSTGELVTTGGSSSTEDAGSSAASTSSGDTGSDDTGTTASSTGAELPSCDDDDGAVEFFADVYPRLAQRGCSARACHDADHSPSGTPEAALAFYLDAELPGGAPVVPGDPDASALVQYLQDYAAGAPTPIVAADVDLVRAWIEAGAPAGAGPSPSCIDDPPLSYAEVVAPIFAAGSCASSTQCHAPGGIYPEIQHDALVDQPAIGAAGWTLVVPGSPDESSLLWHLVEKAQPNHLVDGPEIALVVAWVRDGAAP